MNPQADTARPARSGRVSILPAFRIPTVPIGRPLGQPVRLHPYKEVGAKVLRGAGQRVDVALPLAHMHAALGRADARDGLAQVLQPALALLGFDRHARGIDVPLERERSLELLSRPESHRRQAEGCAGKGDGHARMHQHPA